MTEPNFTISAMYPSPVRNAPTIMNPKADVEKQKLGFGQFRLLHQREEAVGKAGECADWKADGKCKGADGLVNARLRGKRKGVASKGDDEPYEGEADLVFVDLFHAELLTT